MSKTSNRLLKTLLVIGSAAGAIYLFNKYISDSATSKNKLFIKENGYYEWKHGNIYYQKSGKGEPILLIHDFSHCGSSYEWNKIIDELSETHTVYTIDLLGCGRSDKPPITYTNFLYVQLINDFIKQVIGEKTTIISSGFSSSLAIMSSAYDISMVHKLILINPTDIHNITKECTQSERLFKDILELPLIGTFIYNILSSKQSLDRQITENFVYNPFIINTDMIDTYYEAAHRGNSNGKYVLSSYIGKYMNANLSHGLKQLDNDILIIGGEHESNIDAIIEQYTDYNQHIESITIPKTKHIPHFENPEDVLTHITAYL